MLPNSQILVRARVEWNIGESGRGDLRGSQASQQGEARGGNVCAHRLEEGVRILVFFEGRNFASSCKMDCLKIVALPHRVYFRPDELLSCIYFWVQRISKVHRMDQRKVMQIPMLSELLVIQNWSIRAAWKTWRSILRYISSAAANVCHKQHDAEESGYGRGRIGGNQQR